MRMRPAVLAIAALSILCVQAAISLLAFWLLPDWPTRGQFGDVFGGANALFSGLAFAGLIYTVLLQREELSLQRKELELTRQEMHRSASAQEQSEVALRAQAEAASRSARLATANALLEHYRAELRALSGVVMPANDRRRALVQELQRREQALIEILDSMYVIVTTTEEKK